MISKKPYTQVGPKKKWDGRGRTTTKRLETNEEIMLRARERYGYLSIRVAFAVKDAGGAYRGLKGTAIVIKKVPTQGMIGQMVDAVEGALIEFAKRKGK